MANSEDSKRNESSTSELNAEARRDDTHDPEFEIPDPQQVDRDVEEAEGAYGSDTKTGEKPPTSKDKDRVA